MADYSYNPFDSYGPDDDNIADYYDAMNSMGSVPVSEPLTHPIIETDRFRNDDRQVQVFDTTTNELTWVRIEDEKPPIQSYQDNRDYYQDKGQKVSEKTAQKIMQQANIGKAQPAPDPTPAVATAQTTQELDEKADDKEKEQEQKKKQQNTNSNAPTLDEAERNSRLIEVVQRLSYLASKSPETAKLLDDQIQTNKNTAGLIRQAVNHDLNVSEVLESQSLSDLDLKSIANNEPQEGKQEGKQESESDKEKEQASDNEKKQEQTKNAQKKFAYYGQLSHIQGFKPTEQAEREMLVMFTKDHLLRELTFSTAMPLADNIANQFGQKMKDKLKAGELSAEDMRDYVEVLKLAQEISELVPENRRQSEDYINATNNINNKIATVEDRYKTKIDVLLDPSDTTIEQEMNNRAKAQSQDIDTILYEDDLQKWAEQEREQRVTVKSQEQELIDRLENVLIVQNRLLKTPVEDEEERADLLGLIQDATYELRQDFPNYKDYTIGEFMAQTPEISKLVEENVLLIQQKAQAGENMNELGVRELFDSPDKVQEMADIFNGKNAVNINVAPTPVPQPNVAPQQMPNKP